MGVLQGTLLLEPCASRGKVPLVGPALSEGAPSSDPPAPACGHHRSLLEGPEVVFCWVPGLWDLPFRRVAACVPQVCEQGRGGSADVGAVTRVLVAEDDEVEIGCVWCPGAARSAGAELACVLVPVAG